MSKRQGKIIWYHEKKHFGFILSKDNHEVFFHIDNCKEFAPKEGQLVEYEMGLDHAKREKAMNITVTVGAPDENKTN